MSPVTIQFIKDIFTADTIGNPDNYPFKDGHYYRKELPAGGVEWGHKYASDEIGSLKYVCPCGCGAVGHVPVSRDGKQQEPWMWDGNETQPSLTPSIRMLTKCRWHGYLTKGVFTPC